MVGTKEVSGLMSLMVEGLFSKIKQKEVTHDISVRMAYMEIYNENVKDLLSSDIKNLDLREDPKSDFTEVHVLFHPLPSLNLLKRQHSKGLTEVDINDPQ